MNGYAKTHWFSVVLFYFLFAAPAFADDDSGASESDYCEEESFLDNFTESLDDAFLSVFGGTTSDVCTSAAYCSADQTLKLYSEDENSESGKSEVLEISLGEDSVAQNPELEAFTQVFDALPEFSGSFLFQAQEGAEAWELFLADEAKQTLDLYDLSDRSKKSVALPDIPLDSAKFDPTDRSVRVVSEGGEVQKFDLDTLFQSSSSTNLNHRNGGDIDATNTGPEYSNTRVVEQIPSGDFQPEAYFFEGEEDEDEDEDEPSLLVFDPTASRGSSLLRGVPVVQFPVGRGRPSASLTRSVRISPDRALAETRSSRGHSLWRLEPVKKSESPRGTAIASGSKKVSNENSASSTSQVDALSRGATTTEADQRINDIARSIIAQNETALDQPALSLEPLRNSESGVFELDSEDGSVSELPPAKLAEELSSNSELLHSLFSGLDSESLSSASPSEESDLVELLEIPEFEELEEEKEDEDEDEESEEELSELSPDKFDDLSMLMEEQFEVRLSSSK